MTVRPGSNHRPRTPREMDHPELDSPDGLALTLRAGQLLFWDGDAIHRVSPGDPLVSVWGAERRGSSPLFALVPAVARTPLLR